MPSTWSFETRRQIVIYHYYCHAVTFIIIILIVFVSFVVIITMYIYIYLSLSLILIVHWSLGVYTLFSNKPSPMVFLTGLAQEQTGAQDGIDHTFGAFEKPLLNAKESKSEPKSDSVLNSFLYVWRNHLRFLGVWAILYCMWIIHYVNESFCISRVVPYDGTNGILTNLLLSNHVQSDDATLKSLPLFKEAAHLHKTSTKGRKGCQEIRF